MTQAGEPIFVQALVPEVAVKRFDIGVLIGFAWLDKEFAITGSDHQLSHALRSALSCLTSKAEKMGRKLEDIIAEQPQEVVYAAEEIASKQLIHLRLIELLKRIGADASYQIDGCTVDSLQQLKQIVESSGGKIHLHIDLPDGSNQGFKLLYSYFYM